MFITVAPPSKTIWTQENDTSHKPIATLSRVDVGNNFYPTELPNETPGVVHDNRKAISKSKNEKNIRFLSFL